jgi:hypothetical protein
MHDLRYRQVQAVAVAAGLVTVILTGIAFWLSYEHLAEVAAGHGLPGVRGWAWPSTVDLFIVLGELLVLRASLQGERDWFAFSITAGGSLASIALNVAGVGEDASKLEYIVAGVPPVAALLAFGALMRQVHEALKDQPSKAVTTDLQPLVEALEEPLEALETEAVPLEAPAMEVESPLPSWVEEALETPTITQEELVEKLVAGGEPLPGRKTVADTYGVSDWTARRALEVAKERLQEADWVTRQALEETKRRLQGDAQATTLAKES